MAGARQRLHHRRARRASVRADAGAGAAHLRRRTSAATRTACCCSSPPSDPRFVASLRIFNPDGSEAELSGNGAREAILYLRRHGWTDQRRVLDRDGRRRGPADDHSTTAPAASRWGARGCSSPDFPSGGEDGRGTVIADGRELAFQHVSIGNPQCVIEVGEGLEELDLVAHRPADRGQRAVPEPHQRVVHPTSTPATGCARGSSSAGWGRRCRPAPARPARR